MSQQINLFNPIFLKQKKYFSALMMAQGLGLFLVGCLLMVIYAEFQVSYLSRNATETSTQLLKAKSQLISVSAQFAPREANPALENEIRNADANVHSMQKVFDALHSGEFGDTKGYSSYFRAFARRIVDGVWLTGVSINGAGHDIGLKGRALKPEYVPLYLSRLSQEADMQGKSFSALDMQVPKADPAATVNSSGPAAPGVPPVQAVSKGAVASSANATASTTASAGVAAPAFAPYIEFDLEASGVASVAKDKNP